MPLTYLEACMKDGQLMRWPAKAMPIAVYIKPFQWYEADKRQQAFVYDGMVRDAFMTWAQVSEGAVRFAFVPTLNQSQMDVSWRPVDRKSLGHCEYSWDKLGIIYSANISIGISNGMIHHKYNDPKEVQHTILHEVGHALGLVGHSPFENDMMYVPHQYGITQLSQRDVATLRWLYRLPVGFKPAEALAHYGLTHLATMDDLLLAIEGGTEGATQASAAPFNQALTAVAANTPTEATPQAQEEALNQQADWLAQRGQFLMATSLITTTSIDELL
jgi:hypothetical protein